MEDLDTWQTISVPVTTSADLINLEKNSQYAVAVCAKTKTGLGRLSAVVDNVKIKPEDVPLHLTAEDLSTHSMTLRWSRPVRLNPIEYRVRLLHGFNFHVYDTGKCFQKISFLIFFNLLMFR